MSRVDALFSSLCLSPALLCSLESSLTESETLTPQVVEVQPIEAVTTEPIPAGVEIPEAQSSEVPIIEAAVEEPSSREDDNTNSVQESEDETVISPVPEQPITVEYSEKCCGCTPRPQRVEVRHIEAKGIGYNKGYTTLEGFFVLPSTLENNWVPFLDIRGHVFNDGHPAVNAGLGLRYLSSRVWGANIYYDYRKTSRVHYNQIGAGLETLGKVWDFRINGYFPVGKRESGS